MDEMAQAAGISRRLEGQGSVVPTDWQGQYHLLQTTAPNADVTVCTLTLNPDTRFSDGTPLSAEAIMFNSQRIADPAPGSFCGPLTQQFKIKVIDELKGG
ncbi:ABC transporter substrate-binding protein [Dactylosporangium sp. CA-092794]|uniref:ABC transporter substrate-binding protein n=1 Tax=Dactylosporangium sp. CA-092794 TaxID=3239929 RepID=UPI003D91D95D